MSASTPQLRARKNAANQPASVASASSSVTTSGKHDGDRLLYFEELPSWLQDNHYIRSGYRAESRSLWRSLKSVAAVHNETVNIWTHLLPSIVFLGFLAYFSFYEIGAAAEGNKRAWLGLNADASRSGGGSLLYRVAVALQSPSVSSTDLFVFLVFFSGASAMFTCSWSYHTMSNHSPGVARWWNKADYLGIVCMILGSFAPSLYYGYYCDPFRLKAYLYVLNSLGAACAVVTAMDRFRTPAWRPYRAGMFVLLGLSAVVPVVEGLVSEQLRARNSPIGKLADVGAGDPLQLGIRGGIWKDMALTHTAAQGALYIFGATLYAMRFPEKWAYNSSTASPSASRGTASGKGSGPAGAARTKGAFDIFGSSHQIFHICVVLAGIVHFCGLLEAFSYRHGVLGGVCPLL